MLNREEFDRDRDFVCIRADVKVSGKPFGYGDVFDKTLVTTRRLRQMYENKFLDMLPYDASLDEDDASSDLDIDFEQLPKDAIILWLQSHNIIPRSNWGRKKLIDRAKQEQEKLRGTVPEDKKVDETVE